MAAGNPQGFPNIDQPIASARFGVDGKIIGYFITRAWLLLIQALWQRTGAALGGSVTPPGVVADFAGPEANCPPGWLVCGQAVSRTEFSLLFAAIGTAWGPGNGSTTFDLPPQGRFSKGVGGDAVGDTGGASSVTLSIAQLPAHSHGVTDPGHTHVVTDPGHIHAITDPGHVHAITDPGHTHTIPNTATGGGATAGGTTGTTNTGSNTTGITVNSNTTGLTVNSHTTGLTNQTAATGITTNNTGSGDSVDILPPYAVFLKIIKY